MKSSHFLRIYLLHARAEDIQIPIVLKRFLILLLVCLVDTSQAQTNVDSTATVIHPSVLGWYKITESDNNAVWSVGGNIRLDGNSHSHEIQLMGYTNNGSTLTGMVNGHRILFPKKSVVVTPFGGDGKAGFTIVAEAKGTLKKNVIRLEYVVKADTFPETHGVIKAVRLAAQDTTMNGVYYEWIKYDLNKNAYEIGEHNNGGIKNGHWLFRDQQCRLSEDVHYVNDTLNGGAVYYYYANAPKVVKLEGINLQGKKTGVWFLKERKNMLSRWRTTAIYNYDNDEHMISRTLTYKNGKPQVQIFYSNDEKEMWYRFYTKNGKMYKDDKVFPWNYEIEISQ